MVVATARVVQILRAVFHFDAARSQDASLIVAHIYCEPHRVTIEPTEKRWRADFYEGAGCVRRVDPIHGSSPSAINTTRPLPKTLYQR